MWAYVTDNTIQEIIKFPKSMVIDSVRHPRTIFTAWSWTELNAVGIYTVEAGTQGDDRFEYTSQPTYAFDSANKKVTTTYTKTDKALADSNAVDEDGNNLLDADGNQIINYGLKHHAKEQAKRTAHGLIKRFGWLVQRVTMDSSKTIPSAVTTYCAAIRTDCADICTAIDNASDMSAFRGLYTDTVNADGEITQINRINRWTSDNTVKDYIR
ncbi:N-acetylmuramidase/lysin [uncultured Mediterranean phage uvMED]|nr:N-acetylmuramidase/lysin [uncultured Mediterranean phage uvMED]